MNDKHPKLTRLGAFPNRQNRGDWDLLYCWQIFRERKHVHFLASKDQRNRVGTSAAGIGMRVKGSAFHFFKGNLLDDLAYPANIDAPDRTRLRVKMLGPGLRPVWSRAGMP
jgi:hypothetical protein